MRQEEVENDENEQGDEGKMVKMLQMETRIGEIEQELISFKFDNDLYMVEEREDKFFLKNKQECTLVESFHNGADSKEIGKVGILEKEQNDLHMVEEKEDEFCLRNKEDCMLVETDLRLEEGEIDEVEQVDEGGLDDEMDGDKINNDVANNNDGVVFIVVGGIQTYKSSINFL